MEHFPAASLTELYISELQDLYSTESQLIKALPKMAEGATFPDLSSAFSNHLGQTRTHAQRLERILTDLGEKPGAGTCQAMDGLVSEGSDALAAKGDDTVRDAGIIIAAQKVEHYEIAGYGSACALANCLGRTEDVTLLHQTLEEEKEADALLSRLAESHVNNAAR